MKKPIEMTFRPSCSSGVIRFCASTWGLPCSPSSVGMVGPYTSASISPTFAPQRTRARAKFALTVDLPTPPLPLAIGMMCLIVGLRLAANAGATARRTCEVIATSTCVTPGSATTACCAWSRS